MDPGRIWLAATQRLGGSEAASQFTDETTPIATSLDTIGSDRVWLPGQYLIFSSGVIQVAGGNMLVLTRRSRQSIMIGDEIEVSVLSVSGEKVRVGIEAPDDVPIFRKEVYLRIAGEGTAPRAGELRELEPARVAQ